MRDNSYGGPTVVSLRLLVEKQGVVSWVPYHVVNIARPHLCTNVVSIPDSIDTAPHKHRYPPRIMRVTHLGHVLHHRSGTRGHGSHEARESTISSRGTAHDPRTASKYSVKRGFCDVQVRPSYVYNIRGRWLNRGGFHELQCKPCHPNSTHGRRRDILNPAHSYVQMVGCDIRLQVEIP